MVAPQTLKKSPPRAKPMKIAKKEKAAPRTLGSVWKSVSPQKTALIIIFGAKVVYVLK